MKKDYEKEYEKLSLKFIELQSIELTDEEKEFRELADKLYCMSEEYRNEFSQLESENTALQEETKEYVSLIDDYNDLLRQFYNLKSLKKSIENVKGRYQK